MSATAYLSVECRTCRRTVRHHVKDVAVKTSRICPGCGDRMEIGAASAAAASARQAK